MFFLWTITLYHSTLSPMPTNRPVPVSINPSYTPSILFSFPSILNFPEFHLLLLPDLFLHFISLSILDFLSLFPFPPFLFLLSLDPALPLFSHAGLWPSYWPGRLFSNVLPDQSRLWILPSRS